MNEQVLTGQEDVGVTLSAAGEARRERVLAMMLEVGKGRRRRRMVARVGGGLGLGLMLVVAAVWVVVPRNSAVVPEPIAVGPVGPVGPVVPDVLPKGPGVVRAEYVVSDPGLLSRLSVAPKGVRAVEIDDLELAGLFSESSQTAVVWVKGRMLVLGGK
ncbi:MAG: hypothetical protein LW822_00445 [Phycisphaeraceae bacterium]|nr:hypothetical protein [Phycisphaeraceae bacterium]